MRTRVKRVLSGVLLAVGLFTVAAGAYMLFLAHQIAELEGRIVVPLPTEEPDEAMPDRLTPTPLPPYTPTPVRTRPVSTAIAVGNLPPIAAPAMPVAPVVPTVALAAPTLPPPSPTPPPPPTPKPAFPTEPPPAAMATPVPSVPSPVAPAPRPPDATVTRQPTSLPAVAPPPLLSVPTATRPAGATPIAIIPAPPLEPSPAPPVPTATVIVIFLLTSTPPAPLPPTVPLPSATPVPTPLPAPPSPMPLPTAAPTLIPLAPPPLPLATDAPRLSAPTVVSLIPNPGGLLRGGVGGVVGDSDGREAVWGGKQIVRILLLGIDRRENEPSRSDTMILATVDLWSGTVNLLSIPRDLVVTIPGYGEDRVNAAFAFGQAARPQDPVAGPALAVKTVSKQFGVPIDHYLFVDFRAFKEIVDAVGGVDIAVPRALDDYAYPTDDYRTVRLHFDAGMQHMDGGRALAYARTRHGDDDNLRRERQMQVMTAVLTRATEIDGLRRMPDVAQRLGDNMQTSLPYDAQVSLVKLTRKFQANGVAQYSIKPPMVHGASGTRWGDVYMGDWAAIRPFVVEATDPRRRPRP